MPPECINPPTLMPPLYGLYAQVTVAPAGRTAYIAGQVAFDEKGMFVGHGDHIEQACQVFLNLKHALDAAGAAPRQVVRMTINVVDHHFDLVPAIFGAGRDVFGDDWPVCASTFLGVHCLAHPDWLIEVDAIAILD